MDVESRLPGIYWCQLVSERMVERTETLEDIIKTAPFACMEILAHDHSKLLWIEIAKDFHKATQKKRLEMRRLFETSLYQISLHKAFHSSSTNWAYLVAGPPSCVKAMMKSMKLMPLSHDEIELFLKMIA